MSIQIARRLFFALIGASVVLLSAPLVFAAPQTAARPQNATSDNKPDKQTVTLAEKFLASFLGSLERPNFKARVNFGNDGNINTAKVLMQIPLNKNTVVTLQERTGNKNIDDVIPTAILKTDDLVINIEVETDPNGNVVTNAITFSNKAGQPKALVFTLRSNLTDLLDVRIDSILTKATGIAPSAKEVVIQSDCNLKQNQVDLRTGDLQWKESVCEFSGTLIKDVKNVAAGKQRFTYRFKFDSF
ncbi:MAG: hypothetical protein NDI61_06830 [Bdellovibrionaceae bacterium]|nr:hypothetical protein [Pseudobdellovibrionaceae bacterium]